MSNPYDQRRAECEEILGRLLAAPRTPLNPRLRLVPKTHGLYAIATKGRPDHEFLHVGISKIGKGGLRYRICTQHRIQNGPSDLVMKILRGFPDKKAATKWIDENCTVQWVEEPDLAVRCAAEHYSLAILRPEWPELPISN
jgi:hypothetical protein